MPVFLREHDSGAYRVSSYFFGRTLVSGRVWPLRFVFLDVGRRLNWIYVLILGLPLLQYHKHTVLELGGCCFSPAACLGR